MYTELSYILIMKALSPLQNPWHRITVKVSLKGWEATLRNFAPANLPAIYTVQVTAKCCTLAILR